MKKLVFILALIFPALALSEPQQNPATSWGDSVIRVQRGRGHPGPGGKEAVKSGDVINGLAGRGYNGSAFTTSDGVSIEFQAAEDWTNSSNGTSIVFKATPNGSTTAQTVLTLGGDLAFSSDHTTLDTAAAAAGGLVEIDGSRFDDAYVGSSGANDVLYSGWRFESTYDISGVAVADTLHGLTIFAEMNSARNNQYFSAGAEFSNKCFAGALSPSNAACVGSIDHTKVFNDQNIPFAFPAIGNNARVDVFDTGFESVDFSTNGTVYVYRPEIYGGKTGMRFNMWSTDTDAQILNGGNILKLPIAQTVTDGATIDVSKSCGGGIILTSAGSVTTATNGTFTAPSSSETNGTFNQGCIVYVTNANLTAGRTITLDFNASNFFSSDEQNVILPPFGGTIAIESYPTGSVWFQISDTTKKRWTGAASLNFGATVGGTCDQLTIAVTGAVDGDPVFIGVPNALASSDASAAFTGYVSATDTVTIDRCCNKLVGNCTDPAAATVRATVIKP